MGLWYATRWYVPLYLDVADDEYDFSFDYYKKENKTLFYYVYHR